MAAASASASASGTRRPFTPSSTISARPPTAPAMSGRPQAMASSADSEVASSTFSERTDGTRMMSASRYNSRMASRPWPPNRRTCSSSPCSRTTRSMASRSPPSPACSRRNRRRCSTDMPANASEGNTTPFFFTSRRGQNNTVRPSGTFHVRLASSRPSQLGKNDEVSMKFIRAKTVSARSGTRRSTWLYRRVSTVTTASARRRARISAPMRYRRPTSEAAV